jgi:hypothetical protein
MPSFIPPPGQVVEVLRLIDAGELPVPDRLSGAATYVIVNGCVDLDAMSLTEQGRRMLTILGGPADDVGSVTP